MPKSKNNNGIVLLSCLAFVCLFSAFAVSMATMSITNVRIANNRQKANKALNSALSGLEVTRYWLKGIQIPGSVGPSQRLYAVNTALNNKLTAQSISNINTSYSSGYNLVNISNVTLNPSTNQTFSAIISQPDADTIQLTITGRCGEFSKQISTNFEFGTIGNSVFDFGVASKGPLIMSGQAEIDAVNLAIEASVYIEGTNISGDAFSITNNASVAGDVTIANEYGTYSIGSRSSVGGASGNDALDHIFVGADYVEFPTPQPTYFSQFATGAVMDTPDDWDNHDTLNNVTIAAGTNPTFASDVTINGVLFIEYPNTVTFAGKSVINGILVGNGPINNEQGSSSINFSGQVICNSVSVLNPLIFGDVTQETGTFICAPGFNLDFSGQANQISGAIAANGISFTGQAGGTVNGSIINYSTTPMDMSGQSTLLFNRSGVETDPSGFVPVKILQYIPSSYSENPI